MSRAQRKTYDAGMLMTSLMETEQRNDYQHAPSVLQSVSCYLTSEHDPFLIPESYNVPFDPYISSIPNPNPART